MNLIKLNKHLENRTFEIDKIPMKLICEGIVPVNDPQGHLILKFIDSNLLYGIVLIIEDYFRKHYSLKLLGLEKNNTQIWITFKIMD